MADTNFTTTSPEPTGMEDSNIEEILPETSEDSPLGVFAPFPYSSEPFAQLSEGAQGALVSLDGICTRSDVAARRMEIEQAWESCHFDRGYQHLFRGKQGGWQLPGQATGYGTATSKGGGVYDTNVYGSKGDIIVAALSREIPKMEFFAANPEYGPDIVAAEEAENFKAIWSRNNNLHALLVDCARIFWNEDRVVLWTRYELNGQKYGFEGETATPTVPQDAQNPQAASEPTGQEGQEDFAMLETSSTGENGVEDMIGDFGQLKPNQRKPLGREVTTAHGKLDAKVPIAVDDISQMQFLQLYFDLDVAIVKATFPWIADKIKSGSDGTSEVELDRIARENVRQAVLGAYVTGDSLKRHTVVKYTWMRPSMFQDDCVADEYRAELLEAFPNGCMFAKAGSEFAFARNESMDDHLVVGHPTSGKGQNRRSMGASLISIQKRINDWVDLLDDFFKRTVPKKWMNSEAFDMEALKTQPNTPGSTGPFTPQPGLTTESQYIMVEPTPQPQTSLADFVKWFITSLSEEISGALPSLFGASTNTDTVGGIAIQRDQALQRVGCPWNNIQDMFAEAARQAVVAAADCRDGRKFTQTVPGKGNITVNTANLVGGNVLCYAESNPAFPESWAQREQKLMTLIDGSANNPSIQAWLFSPSNLPALADGIRMKAFKVPGAASVAKQKMEFEILLRSGPMPNPAVLKAQSALEMSSAGMKQHIEQGIEVPPDAQAKMMQLTAMAQQMPKMVSTIPVAQDESELHAIEADECFTWMNSTEGQKFKYGNAKQQAGYENVHMHWSEHMAVAKKIAAANAPPPKPPSESISAAVDKMPAPVAVQLLDKMGIKASPADFQQHAEDQLNQKVGAKVLPDAFKRGKQQTAAPPPHAGGPVGAAPPQA
jgi:hypothetical protein